MVTPCRHRATTSHGRIIELPVLSFIGAPSNWAIRSIKLMLLSGETFMRVTHVSIEEELWTIGLRNISVQLYQNCHTECKYRRTPSTKKTPSSSQICNSSDGTCLETAAKPNDQVIMQMIGLAHHYSIEETKHLKENKRETWPAY